MFEVPLAFLLDPANQQRHFRMQGARAPRLLGDPVRRALHLGRDRRDADDPRPHAARRRRGRLSLARHETALDPVAAAARAPPTRSARCARSRALARAARAAARSRSCAARRRARSTRRRSRSHADDFRRGVARLIRWWRRVRVDRRLPRRPRDAVAPRHALARRRARRRHAAPTTPRRCSTTRRSARCCDARSTSRDVDARIARRHAARARDQRDELRDRLRDHVLRGGRRDRAAGGARAARGGARPDRRPSARLDRDSVRVSRGAHRTTTGTWTARCGSSRRCRRRCTSARGACWCSRSASSPASARRPHAALRGYPSFAQTAGHALSTIFLDNLGADLERLHQVNRLASACTPDAIARARLKSRPRRRVRARARRATSARLALAYASRLPAGVRYLLRGLGSTRGNRRQPDVLPAVRARASSGRCSQLGYADAMARRDELEAFLAGSGPVYVPVLPPDLA